MGIQGGILARDVDKLLKQYEDIRAVFIVSPTYDGVVSDIKAIAEAVHRAGLPLIVDEAHGAHFRYHESFPQSALELGADVVIQSIHKTLPSLTQTALLHIKCNRPDGGFYGDMEAIDRYLHIYQSSSPSYVFMASIENAIFQMEKAKDGGPLAVQCAQYMDALEALRQRLKGMGCLQLVDKSIVGQGGVYDLDISKLVISAGRTALSGAWLDSCLREEFQLEMEMCGADYVTAITSFMDSPEGLGRLGDALLKIDERLERSSGPESDGTGGTGRGIRPGSAGPGCIYSQSSDIVMTIAEAVEHPFRVVELSESAGSISSEFIYIYPPGIPIVAPGERISLQALEVIQDYIRKGLPVQGPSDESLSTLRIVEV